MPHFHITLFFDNYTINAKLHVNTLTGRVLLAIPEKFCNVCAQFRYNVRVWFDFASQIWILYSNETARRTGNVSG